MKIVKFVIEVVIVVLTTLFIGFGVGTFVGIVAVATVWTFRALGGYP